MTHADIVVRPFRGSDTAALLACWEQALPYDAITLDQLESRVLLDDNFETGGLLVAHLGNALAGFISCFVLNKPIEKTGLMEDRGFIQAFGVAPAHRGKGAGSALLAAAEDFFRARNRSLIVLAPYTPNYFVPGVDKDNYADGLAFLTAHGFTEYSEALAADALIGTFALADDVLTREQQLQAEGITIRHYQRADLAEFMQFQRDLMPGPWVEDARRNLRELAAGRFSPDAIWLAIDERHSGGAKIIGFCQHEHEHFGPFGVSDAYQSKGIGTVLLARTLYQMRLKGCHSAWVLWTGQRALDGVYKRLGFKLTRRFAIMKKELV